MTTKHPPDDAGCAHIRALLAGLGEEEPAPDTIAALEAHLSGCTTCGEAEAALAVVIARYKAQVTPALPLRLEQRILDQICGAD
jgi:hypothetical protein